MNDEKWGINSIEGHSLYILLTFKGVYDKVKYILLPNVPFQNSSCITIIPLWQVSTGARLSGARLAKCTKVVLQLAATVFSGLPRPATLRSRLKAVQLITTKVARSNDCDISLIGKYESFDIQTRYK